MYVCVIEIERERKKEKVTETGARKNIKNENTLSTGVIMCVCVE